MYRKEAKEYIVQHPEVFLELDNRSRNGYHSSSSYVCPICGSGTGKTGTGLTPFDRVDKTHFYCWANNCFHHNDVIDIIGKVYGLTNYNDKLKKACEIYGIEYNKLKCDPEYSKNKNNAHITTHDIPATVNNCKKRVKKNYDANKTDFLQFYKSCIEHRYETNYLVNRGISYDTQEKFWIGYCPHWRSHTAIANGRNPPMTPRIIIPSSRYCYLARDTRPYVTDYTKIREGQSQIFNYQALSNLTSPVFVTEGEIDALSIIEVGFTAVGLGSTSNIDLLIDHLIEHRPSQPVLIALDNDNPGWTAAKKLETELQKMEIENYNLIPEINGNYKDVNERLVADRDGLRKAVEEAVSCYD